MHCAVTGEILLIGEMVKRPLENPDTPYGPGSEEYLRLHFKKYFSFKKSLRLSELERIAHITNVLAKIRHPNSDKDYGQSVTDVLRQLFNLVS